MSTAVRLHFGYDQYLRALEDSELKLEYWDGVIYAMAGGTPSHARLAARIIALLERQLGHRCSVFSSDLKVRAEALNVACFPDASVICGPLQTSASDSNAAVNPTILVEVTSRSTEEHDRGDKLAVYKGIASVQAVLFVSHRARRVTIVQAAAGGGWSERDAGAGETVTLDSPSLRMEVDELYADIALES